MESSHQYDDIIDLPHHVSAKHPQMSMQERAAQFSPFAALTGYQAAVDETARATDRKIVLSEDRIAAINEALAGLRTNDLISAVFFVADERKTGGAYRSAAGAVRKIDAYAGLLLMADGAEIPFDDILSIEKCE